MKWIHVRRMNEDSGGLRMSGMADRVKISLNDGQDLWAAIDAACSFMERVYAGGHYSKISVHRKWSEHNPLISGKIARPSAYHW